MTDTPRFHMLDTARNYGASVETIRKILNVRPAHPRANEFSRAAHERALAAHAINELDFASLELRARADSMWVWPSRGNHDDAALKMHITKPRPNTGDFTINLGVGDSKFLVIDSASEFVNQWDYPGVKLGEQTVAGLPLHYFFRSQVPPSHRERLAFRMRIGRILINAAVRGLSKW